MQTIINGARINYERAGAGFPVIFLHAGVADSRMWEPQVPVFAKQFDIIRPDLRGFGKSELPPEPWSPVHDLLTLIDDLGLKPAHLVGCSMGGGIIIDFALEHPDRISKLVLVGSSIGGFTFRPEHAHVFAEAATARQAGDLAALNEAMLHLFLDGPDRPRGYVSEPLRTLFLDMNAIAVRADFDKATPAQNVLALRRLHEITAPTLVVVGDKDVPTVLEAADLLADSIPWGYPLRYSNH
ncbi:MAG: alpha/beta fold hydrolase [Candidatus Dormibacteraceae bacterium]